MSNINSIKKINQIINRPTGGGSKKQGIPSSTNINSNSHLSFRIRNVPCAPNKDKIFYMNQLGGIGASGIARNSRMYNPSADGVLKNTDDNFANLIFFNMAINNNNDIDIIKIEEDENFNYYELSMDFIAVNNTVQVHTLNSFFDIIKKRDFINDINNILNRNETSISITIFLIKNNNKYMISGQILVIREETIGTDKKIIIRIKSPKIFNFLNPFLHHKKNYLSNYHIHTLPLSENIEQYKFNESEKLEITYFTIYLPISFVVGMSSIVLGANLVSGIAHSTPLRPRD